MNQKVLLVSTKKSFMAGAIIKSLNSEGLEVLAAAPDLKDFPQFEGENYPRIILVYLDQDSEDFTEFLVFVRDRLIESFEDVRVYLIGSDEEIELAQKSLPPKFIEGIFPRPLNVKDLAAKLSGAAAEAGTADRRKRILVVDDDGMMLRTLKLWLSDHYQVYMANSGVNAISLLAKKEVDLILLDYEMPVASGPEVLQMLRSEPSTSHLPVMFLTAKNDKESVMKVMELGPERYLLKTMPPDVLLKNIDEFFTMQKLKG